MKKLLLSLALGLLITPLCFAGKMSELSIAFEESVEKYIENSQVWAKENGGHIEDMVAIGGANIVDTNSDDSTVTVQGMFAITRYDHEDDLASTHDSLCTGTYKISNLEEIDFSCQ